MTYTDKENGLILFDRLTSILALIELSDAGALANMQRRIADDPTISRMLKVQLLNLIIEIIENGIDGESR